MLLLLVLIGSIVQTTSAEARRIRHHRNQNAAVAVSSSQVDMAILNDLGSPKPRTLTFQIDPSTSIIMIDQAIITPAPTLTSSTSTCVPSSICFDGFTCSQRYGGCYDKNYCDGNTSPYPIPTCDSSPALGLSANSINKGIARTGENGGQDSGEDSSEDSAVAKAIAEYLVAAQMEQDQ